MNAKYSIKESLLIFASELVALNMTKCIPHRIPGMNQILLTKMSFLYPPFFFFHLCYCDLLVRTKASVNDNSAVLRSYMHHIQWAVGQKI